MDAKLKTNIENSLEILNSLNLTERLTETLQTVKSRRDEVKNTAGGYAFEVSDEIRVRRFLILGTTGGTYYSTEKALTINNLEHLISMIKNGKGAVILRELLDISVNGRAPKQEPTMFALALCARYDIKDRGSDLKAKNPDARSLKEEMFDDYIIQLHKTSLYAMQKVCRIPTHLFMFIKYCELISKSFGHSTGWSRMMRKAISAWYLEKDPKSLANHITKYRQREGWSHRDVLRLSHPEVASKNDDALIYDYIFHFATHGVLKTRKRKSDASLDGQPVKKTQKNTFLVTEAMVERAKNSDALLFLKAYQDMKNSISAEECANFIYDYGFVREHIPNPDFLNYAYVWRALLDKMPMIALIRNLSKLSNLGIITGDDPGYEMYVEKVVNELTNEESLKKARVHPLTLLLALTTYKSGHGHKGSLYWKVNPRISTALEKAFMMSFKNVEPTGKRYCLAYDVSGSMGAQILGTNLSCKEASVALGMCFLKTETSVEFMAFKDKFEPLLFTKDWDLEQMTRHINHMPFGATDCSLPMQWALKNGKHFDVFIVFTDNETYYGKMKPFEAIRKYRTNMKIPDAKLIVMGLTSTNFTIADPTDPRMLDVVGFDSAVPELVRNFVMGEI